MRVTGLGANEIVVALGDKAHLDKAFAEAGIKDVKIIERSADYDARPAEPQHQPQTQMQPQTGAGLGGLADVARDVLKGSKYGGGGYGHGYDPRYGKKRKKSFLEQIFD